ncbi:MAG: leucine-rich repeat domain-containing protein, partial [Treponemataceae bacterium]
KTASITVERVPDKAIASIVPDISDQNSAIVYEDEDEKGTFIVEGISGSISPVTITFEAGNVTKTVSLTVTGLSYKLEGLEVDDGGITRNARNVPVTKARNVSKLKSTREEEGEGDPITLTLTGLGTLTTLTELVVPDELHGIPVTAIADRAFHQNINLTRVTMGKNIKTIGERAFYADDGKMTNLVLNEGIESIGNHAFCHQHIEGKLYISKSIKNIEYGAFTNNKLDEITIDPLNTSYTVNDKVLYTIDMKTLKTYPNADTRTSFAVPDSVETIESISIYGAKNLKQVWIPLTVKTIGYESFYALAQDAKLFTKHETKPPSWPEKWYVPENGLEPKWGEEKPDWAQEPKGRL